MEAVIGNLVSLDDFNVAYPSNVFFIIKFCVKSVTNVFFDDS